jgi:hypothetical protein
LQPPAADFTDLNRAKLRRASSRFQPVDINRVSILYNPIHTCIIFTHFSPGGREAFLDAGVLLYLELPGVILSKKAL